MDCSRIEWIKISTTGKTTGYLLNLGECTRVSRARRLNTVALHNPVGLTVLSRGINSRRQIDGTRVSRSSSSFDRPKILNYNNRYRGATLIHFHHIFPSAHYLLSFSHERLKPPILERRVLRVMCIYAIQSPFLLSRGKIAVFIFSLLKER